MTEERLTPSAPMPSQGYADAMDRAVIPALTACRHDRAVKGAGGRPLFASRFDAREPAGTVVIVHGFTENTEKYAEVICALLGAGFSVVAYDQRGHGRSWRDPQIADPSLTHVDDFDEYVEDLEAVCAQVLEGMPKPWALFAHSMGGAVAALYLMRHPGVFERAVLCAPMIAPCLYGLPQWAARLLCGTMHALGKDKARVFGSKPYRGPESYASGCATGRERFDWYDALKARTPEFQNNGPTYGWTAQAIRASRMLLSPGAAEKIDAQVLLYTAEDDRSVLPGPQARFAARLRRGTRTLVPGSRHEIYRSKDAVLFPWWQQVATFLRGEEVNEGEPTRPAIP